MLGLGALVGEVEHVTGAVHRKPSHLHPGVKVIIDELSGISGRRIAGDLDPRDRRTGNQVPQQRVLQRRVRREAERQRTEGRLSGDL